MIHHTKSSINLDELAQWATELGDLIAQRELVNTDPQQVADRISAQLQWIWDRCPEGRERKYEPKPVDE